MMENCCKNCMRAQYHTLEGHYCEAKGVLVRAEVYDCDYFMEDPVMKLESNYIGRIYGLQHKVSEMLLPDERIEIHDTPVRGEISVYIKGPKYGAHATIRVADLEQEESVLEWFKQELDKVRADWRVK